MQRRPPRLPELAVRLMGVGVLLVIAAHWLQFVLVRPMLPVFGGTVELLAPQFTLESLDLTQAQPPTVRLRAIVLAWPASGLPELLLRVALGLSMAALVLLCEAPMTMVAELWSLVRDQADP